MKKTGKKTIHYLKQRWKKITSISNIKSIEKAIVESDKPVALLGTPEYCNLGDHLIAYATIKFWEQYFEEETIIEFTRECLERNPSRVLTILKTSPFKKIVITGGGFLGDLWPEMQILINKIIAISCDRKIIILPQTIYYKKPYENNQYLLNDKKIYLKASQLTTFVRDRRSYNMLTETNLFENHSINLAPDMALFLSPIDFKYKNRSGIFLCFRHDKECLLSSSQENDIKKIIRSAGVNNISEGDTVDKYADFSPRQREKKIRAFTNKLFKKQLVITNRLHCMIFCYLSYTPCIVLDNISKKISGVFEWISECNYLRWVSFEDLTPVLINEMLRCVPKKVDRTELTNAFLTMAKNMEEFYD